MPFGKYKPTTDPDWVVADPPRAVRVQDAKQKTLISASCDIGGSICFVRASASGQGSRLVRMFGLLPPEPFTEDVVVFGLGGSMLERLKRDDALVKAVDMLLKAGSQLSMQKNKLTFTVGNGEASKSKKAFSYSVGTVATRLEMLVGAYANDATGPSRLALPYFVYLFASASTFSICGASLKSSLTPLTIVGYSLGLAWALATVAFVFAIPAHLRKHALGGAIVSTVFTFALLGSIFLGAGLAIFGNTYLGEKLLSTQHIRMLGTIVITREKNTQCWLYLDRPSSTLVPGMSFKRLSLKCRRTLYYADPTSRLYEVEINPGLLGAPFVQSIHAVDGAAGD